MNEPYLPSLTQRIKLLWQAKKFVRDPARLAWRQGDVLVIMNAVEAYRAMFTADMLDRLLMLIKDARDNEVPIVFTRWCRFNNLMGDAIDQKNHWSEYLPSDQTELLDELEPHEDDLVIHVKHANALYHPQLLGMAEDASRLVLAGGWAEGCIAQTAHASTELSHLSPAAIVSDALVGQRFTFTAALVNMSMYCADIVRID
ncbi:MAG: isochorismatase family protein [Rhodothermaceae bacterium TMED105]|jgi:nicotinamidase-related amidase|nr:MAG: isochorismatase family protein [Rhodothermaceae bacterium TMED105]|tara:strand:- start:4893 stop:5495 length:603 start_codon:yes stop_codon:yes gene_type:complete